MSVKLAVFEMMFKIHFIDFDMNSHNKLQSNNIYLPSFTRSLVNGRPGISTEAI